MARQLRKQLVSICLSKAVSVYLSAIGAGYAGKNFTDRQRIKRKAQRWGQKYRALPNAERLAVLAAIMEEEGSEAAKRRILEKPPS
jgi:hypothetical protein